MNLELNELGIYELVVIADMAVVPMRRLAEDVEHRELRGRAAEAIGCPLEAIDAFSRLPSDFPPCPISGAVVSALRGDGVVTAEEATRYARALDDWAAAVERIAA